MVWVEDAWGYKVATESKECVDHINLYTDGIMRYSEETQSHAAQAVNSDPSCCLALVLLAQGWMTNGEHQPQPH